MDFEKIGRMPHEGPSKKIWVSQQSMFLIFQNIVIDPQQQQISDDCSSSAQDSSQSSFPGDCPPTVNCSKSQTRIYFQGNSEEVCCTPLLQSLEKWFAIAVSLISFK